MPDASTDGMATWIAGLRGRLARGELAALPPVRSADGGSELPGEITVRIMLADLDHYGDLPASRREARPLVLRKLALMADLQRLRDRIG